MRERAEPLWSRRSLIAASSLALATTGSVLRAASPHLPSTVGAAANGITDDTAALAKLFAGCEAGGVIDLEGRVYLLSGGLRIAKPGTTLRNGTLKIRSTDVSKIYAITAADDCIIEAIRFVGPGAVGTEAAPRLIGGVFSGNGDYPAPMNSTPANRVTVRDCEFSMLTVGVFVGGASREAVPRQWLIENCQFKDLVGFPGQSEGYGALLSPARDSAIRSNVFNRIRRHAIYLASNATNNLVQGNRITDCDNIAIHMNTFREQAPAVGNRITHNTIKRVTKLGRYKYQSAVAIGLNGNFHDCEITDNTISEVHDAGIVCSAISLGESGSRLMILRNSIDVPAYASDCAIRCEGITSGRIAENSIILNGSVYGIVLSDAANAKGQQLPITGNLIDVRNAKAVPFRIVSQAKQLQSLDSNIVTGLANGAPKLVRTQP